MQLMWTKIIIFLTDPKLLKLFLHKFVFSWLTVFKGCSFRAVGRRNGSACQVTHNTWHDSKKQSQNHQPMCSRPALTLPESKNNKAHRLRIWHYNLFPSPQQHNRQLYSEHRHFKDQITSTSYGDHWPSGLFKTAYITANKLEVISQTSNSRR